MPDTSAQLLYGLGPFAGMKANHPDVFVDVRPFAQAPTSVESLSNIDTHRNHFAATTSYGRVNFIQFAGLVDVQSLVRYDVAVKRPYWIANDSNGRISYYDLHNTNFVDLGDSNATWTIGVQCDGNIFFNDGTQMYVDNNGVDLHLTQWQGPPISGTPTITKVPFSPGLAQQFYYYAFTIITIINSINGNIVQESEAIGALQPFPFHKDVTDDDTAVQIAGLPGGGTNDDGTTFKTRIYRLSTNQPNWFLLATTSDGTYVDSATDQSIAGNQQLSFSGQQPPVNQHQNWPIAEYLDRMWVFSVVKNAGTNGQPQTQLWYSNLGQGWNFDDVAQVLPVGNENTNPDQRPSFLNPPYYGEMPVALTKFGSLLIAWRTADSWFVTGQDENTFQVITLFDSVGCCAPFGPIVGRGLMAWPADSGSGYWSFDGGNLQYISDDIFEDIQAMNPADWCQQVGWYWNNFFCWSFPTLGITWRWHAPSQTWDTLPYALSSVAATRTESSNALNALNVSATPPMNQAVGVRLVSDGVPSNILDSWFAHPISDLGVPVVGDIVGPYSDGQQPHATKTLRWIVLEGPPQPGATATVTLHRDFDMLTPWTAPPFDLGSAYPWLIQVPDDSSQAMVYSLEISLSPPAPPPPVFGGGSAPPQAPAQLWKAEIYGEVHRPFAIKV